MTPEQVLSYKPNVLTQRQRESYFESGYLLLERIIPTEIIERLRRVTAEKVEETRRLTKSDAVWDLEPGHNANKPKLRRLSSPCDHHPAYWDYATRPLVDNQRQHVLDLGKSLYPSYGGVRPRL